MSNPAAFGHIQLIMSPKGFKLLRVNSVFVQWTSRCCRVPWLPSVTPAGLRRMPLSQREERFDSFLSALFLQYKRSSPELVGLFHIQSQSIDPAAERLEAAFPWFWTSHSLDPRSAGGSHKHFPQWINKSPVGLNTYLKVQSVGLPPCSPPYLNAVVEKDISLPTNPIIHIWLETSHT